MSSPSGSSERRASSYGRVSSCKPDMVVAVAITVLITLCAPIPKRSLGVVSEFATSPVIVTKTNMEVTGNAGTLIITGGGRGIGASTAQLAGGREYAVCVNYLRDEAA